MNITVIGSGYVGLVCGSCLADLGHKVTCVDTNSSKIKSLQKGKLSIYEPGLEKLIRKGLSKKNLIFTTSYKKGCKNQILFLCLDTPSLKNGGADLSNLYSSIRSIKDHLTSDCLIINKSTVPLGTAKKIKKQFLKSAKFNVEVCSNPEFLREGQAIKDFMDPERIIIGVDSDLTKRTMQEIYCPINKKHNKKIFMSIESAELTKYAANSFLASKISFMNEISILAENYGGNMHEIREGIGSDSRIGPSFLNAGLGFGGSCFPKDLKAIIHEQKKLHLPQGIVASALDINKRQLDLFYKKILNFYQGNIKKKDFFIWGLAFKPNTDDIRESVSIKLIKKLSPKVNSLTLYDSLAVPNAKKALKGIPNISFTKQKYSNFHQIHGLIICTEDKEFFNPRISELKKLQDEVIFDGRNILERSILEKNNFHYEGIGV
jgi:UDPglucose 6-dehydrogenase